MSTNLTAEKPAIIHATGTTDINSITAPSLVVLNTSNYDFIYWDKGSGATLNGTIFRPQPAPGYFIIGDYAQGNYSAAAGTSITVMAVNDDPARPLLMPPTGFNQLWTDVKSGGDMDGSVWYPVAPDGYIALGFVGQSGYLEPIIPSYRCVRQDLVQQSPVTNLIWSDQESGATMDVALYGIQGLPGAFVAQGNYAPFVGVAYSLKAGNS
jgi:hypothetical protein